MRNCSTDTADRPATLADGVDLLARVADLASQRDQLVRTLIHALGEANRAGIVEALEGLPMDLWLAVGHGMNAAERSILLTAADVLVQMPALDQAWAQGHISWSVVRDIVSQVRRLGRDGRTEVDARLAASGDLLADLDPDQISWAVADAVESVRGATAKEREEDAAARESFLAFQMRLDGGSKVFGELDALDTAIATGTLDARHRQMDLAEKVAKTGGPDQPRTRRRRRRTRAQNRARALIDLCRDDLSGHDRNAQDPGGQNPNAQGPDAQNPDGQDLDGQDHFTAPGSPGPPRTRRRARRPLVIVHVPLDRITETAAGLLEVAVPGSLPRLSAALTDNLCRDADVKAVLFDGKRPLHVTRKTRAPELPDDTRLAVLARDLGARDPAGRTPVPLSHVHHLIEGYHHPDHLTTVSPRGHLRLIHRYGWTGSVRTDDATVTWTRGPSRPGQQIRTRPWGTPLNQPAINRIPEPGREPG